MPSDEEKESVDEESTEESTDEESTEESVDGKESVDEKKESMDFEQASRDAFPEGNEESTVPDLIPPVLDEKSPPAPAPPPKVRRLSAEERATIVDLIRRHTPIDAIRATTGRGRSTILQIAHDAGLRVNMAAPPADLPLVEKPARAETPGRHQKEEVRSEKAPTTEKAAAQVESIALRGVLEKALRETKGRALGHMAETLDLGNVLMERYTAHATRLGYTLDQFIQLAVDWYLDYHNEVEALVKRLEELTLYNDALAETVNRVLDRQTFLTNFVLGAKSVGASFTRDEVDALLYALDRVHEIPAGEAEEGESQRPAQAS